MIAISPRSLIPHPQNQAIYGHEDLSELEASIREHGCLEAIVVTPEYVVVSGHRRLRVALDLGLPEVPIRIQEFDSDNAVLEALLLANLYRAKTPEQKAREGMQWEKIIAERAKQRQLSKLKNQSSVVEAASTTEQGRTRDLVGEIIGTSGRNYAQQKQVIAILDESPPPIADAMRVVLNESAETALEVAKQAPEKAIEVAERIQAGASAKEAWQAVKKEQRTTERAAQKQSSVLSLPNDTYSVIYADPPWQYSNSGFNSSAQSHYDTMPTQDICQLLDIQGIQVANNAVLLLWVTNPLLVDGLRVMEAWGFDYKTNLVWVKDKATNIGFYARGKHELLFIGTRGNFTPFGEGSLPESVIEAPRTEHSRKPDLYDLIERLYPEQNYLELFARWQTPRPRWHFWGNQVDG